MTFKSQHSVETASGRFLDLANPEVEMISVHDIAWGLSRQPRFCGQTLGNIPLSVAQHSTFVARIAKQVLTPGTEIQSLALQRFKEVGNFKMVDALKCATTCYRLRFLAFKVGLAHDGSEAFLCDLPTPAKKLPGIIEGYSRAEKALMNVIYQVMGCKDAIDNPIVAAVLHYADAYSLTYEAWHLVPSKGRNWSSVVPICESDRRQFDRVLTPRKSYDSFMGIYGNGFNSELNKFR